MSEPCFAPNFAPRNGLECFLRAIVLIPAIILMFLFSWIPAVHCRLLQALFELRMCHRGNQDQTIDLKFDPNQWLAENQMIGTAVIWQELSGDLRPHARWTAAEKRNLSEAFWKARLDEEIGIAEAPPEAAPEIPGGTWYPRDLAWACFIAYVAQTLAVEHARWVSWSLTTYTGEQLATLLDSRSLFSAERGAGRYAVNPLVHGEVTYGDPVRIFRFLRRLDPTPSTSRATIERLLDWCRSNLEHFVGFYRTENYVNHWGYSGYPPVERIISGTMRERPPRRAHFTAGCRGTVGFLRAVLRTANIPVERKEACDHAQVHFVREDVFLSHADDPYAPIALSSPLPAVSEILIDRPTYERLFGRAVPPAQQCANLDRRMLELALRNPNSNALLWARCQDIARGLSNAAGSVYVSFRSLYSVAELEAMGLWRRIDDEIARRGGCERIPPGW